MNKTIEKSKASKVIKPVYKYGVIQVQVWGGTRAHPKIVGHHVTGGVVYAGWLHYKDGNRIRKYKTNAHKVEWIKEFATYPEFSKAYPEFKGKKKQFTDIAAERIK